MTSCADCRSMFDLCSEEEVFELKEVNPILKETPNPAPAASVEDKNPEDAGKEEGTLIKEVSDKMVCSACRCPFINREEQREHYKLDWHRFNLRQKIAGLPPLTAEEFERKTGDGDLSSISGSESDSEEEDFDNDSREAGSRVTSTDEEMSAESQLSTGRLYSKVFFQNSAGDYLSFYRCVLHGKSDDVHDAVSSLKAISKKTVWVILMTGGGHFAGAVFEGKQILQHKTFHRYTVRAKRGTAQGLRDSQNRSRMAKSAGAALRRHNEASLVKDVQDLLVTWAEHLNKASAIFIRSPSYNRVIFFGGSSAPLNKKDPRIRTIPFATRRATFREVQRVHEVLSTIQVYGKDTDMSAVFSPPKKAWKKTVKSTAQKNTDQEEGKEQENNHSSDKEEEGEIQLEMVELTLGTLHLRESEIYPSRHKRRRRRRKEDDKSQNEDDQREGMPEAAEAEGTLKQMPAVKKKNRKAPSKKQQEDAADDSCDYGLKDGLYTACKVGDVSALSNLLQPPEEMAENQEQSESNASVFPNPQTLLNKPIDSSGFTLLHVAAAAAQKAAVKMLLDAGADPACRDKKGQTPYIVAPDKDTRNVFRKYMAENPDKYDYSKAQVPGPLTAEIESKMSEKKKAQRAQRKQREKEQKEDKRLQELEVEEKKRFASLTDREKRALAAEKRLAQQAAATGVSLSNIKRCWCCGESLLGKIPFHYLEFTFCTPRCVQAHRKGNVPSGGTQRLENV
ncbi:tRNA endonuclease ANKZF1 isoform X2 [Cololabis saira]|uniref:tRNA endonuclease ANKZF1 isoform X2 n=1 Tax=Cololabis saira TaxID=129043 RepID=UPI002AD4DF99|nr:tRNA endonuclease ANKZF1 isoform X2 [Cololabis saira]